MPEKIDFLQNPVYGVFQIPGLVGLDICNIAASCNSWTEVGTYCGRSYIYPGVPIYRLLIINWY